MYMFQNDDYDNISYHFTFKKSQWEIIEVVIEKLLQFGCVFRNENSKYQDEIKTIIENQQSYVLK